MRLFEHILIERQAARIEDPVERLRYLRLTMGRESAGRQIHLPPPVDRVLGWAVSAEFWKTRGSWMMLSLVAFSLSLVTWRPAYTTVKSAPRPVSRLASIVPSSKAPEAPAPNAVWLVERRDGVENYSNGLRIDDKYAVDNDPRQRYPVYGYGKPVDGYGKDGQGVVEWRTAPSGIVYHSTESHLAPFQPDENRQLVRIGSAVLEFVRQNRSYHFVIDRFGRVFRIVREEDIAFHAGNSVWGDDRGLFVNLNASFIGVAFESATEPDAPNATPAQIHASRVLTEMLRSKYRIPAADCVTHAQVSVNPNNMLIGYHTDWAGVFPFDEVGLPDNYGAAPASVFAFGFGYDGTYVKITGNRVWQGLLRAEDRMQRQAAISGLPLSKYKAGLQQRYRQITAALKSKSPEKENHDESE